MGKRKTAPLLPWGSKCTKIDCIYKVVESRSNGICNYYGITGERRNSDPAQCNKYVPSKGNKKVEIEEVKRKAKKKKAEEVRVLCESCENCLPIGEGDHLCDSHMVIVISGYEPTEDYMLCKGKDFNRR